MAGPTDLIIDLFEPTSASICLRWQAVGVCEVSNHPPVATGMPISRWTWLFPSGRECSASQAISSVRLAERSRKPRTALGRRLIELRERAIAGGMKLLSEEEVIEEVKRRRGEIDEDETNLC